MELVKEAAHCRDRMKSDDPAGLSFGSKAPTTCSSHFQNIRNLPHHPITFRRRPPNLPHHPSTFLTTHTRVDHRHRVDRRPHHHHPYTTTTKHRLGANQWSFGPEYPMGGYGPLGV
jgi:hypothetical protein